MTTKTALWLYCRHCDKQFLREDYEIVRKNKDSKKYFGVSKCNLCGKKVIAMLKKDFCKKILVKDSLN